jgi:hypothetical protein
MHGSERFGKGRSGQEWRSRGQECEAENARSDFLSVMSSGVAHNEATRPLILGALPQQTGVRAPTLPLGLLESSPLGPGQRTARDSHVDRRLGAAKPRSRFVSAVIPHQPMSRSITLCLNGKTQLDRNGLGREPMADQDLWFEPVDLLSRCSLNEGLLWVWADRVPINNDYREKSVFDSLQDWECERLNIPPVPKGVRRAAQYLTEERLRSRNYGKTPKDAREYHVRQGMEEAEAVRQWLPLVTAAMDLPAAELFLKLRRGEIETQGKLLPAGVEIIDFLEDQNSYRRGDFNDLADAVIPHEFWTMSGIDWLSNAVTAHGNCYCDVSISVEALMRQFPGERTPVGVAEFVGDLLLVKEPSADKVRPLLTRAPGRPPAFAWEAFHVEVADLIKSGRMPEKKEAAIQHMVSWFENAQKQKPSRSAVSEKLTPYYRRFFSAGD